MFNNLKSMFSDKDNTGLFQLNLDTAVAALLLEIGHADDEFTPEEKYHVYDIIKFYFNLNQNETEELIKIAELHREQSKDLWQFTNKINQEMDRDEKLDIIEEFWRIIYSDGILDEHEDFLIHKLGTLLNLTHPELIDAKMQILDELNNQE